jgi:thiosulfate/3-mercaptopyruvate sulfurtransferase
MKANTLVSVAELRDLLAQGEVLVADCRFDLADPGLAERAYREGHVPGAVRADLDRDLSDLSRPGLGRHPLPTDEAFSATLSRWGWRPGLAVVAYDDASGALAAARLWWLLRLAGNARVAVLDGGWSAWRAAGAPIDAGEEATRAPSRVDLRFDGDAVVGYAGLERLRAEGSALLVDARAAPRFRGEVEPLDPVAGHVPGAVNRPYADNLQPTGLFKPAAILRHEWQDVLAGREARAVVHMCGSGVTACHNLLAMEHAGLAGSRVFAPSWSGWVSDRSRPVATGA